MAVGLVLSRCTPNNPDLVAIATGSYNGTDRIFLSQDATSRFAYLYRYSG
jgi:hypothetical protein